MRDDPKLGVEVRYVYPNSPAAKAGLKAGDRIVNYGDAMAQVGFTGSVAGREELLGWLNAQSPGAEIKLDVKSPDGKTASVTAVLANLPGTSAAQDDHVPDALPVVATQRKALAPLETKKPNPKAAKTDTAPAKPETGLVKHNTPDGEHTYWLYVPENYDPNIAHAMLIWLHPPGKNKEADFESITDAWSDFCKANHIVMVCPASENEAGWTPSEADVVVAAASDAIDHCTIDRQRVLAHGLGVGGQMAIYLGFSKRDLIRGVVATGAVVTQLKDNIPAQRLAFYLSGGALDPLVKSIAESRTRLQERKFPVIFREVPGRGREYFDEDQIREVVRWIDSLDRL